MVNQKNWKLACYSRRPGVTRKGREIVTMLEGEGESKGLEKQAGLRRLGNRFGTQNQVGHNFDFPTFGLKDFGPSLCFL